MKRLVVVWWVVVLAATVFPVEAVAQYDVPPKNSQDGTPVPDVDKAGIQQGVPVVPPVPPNPGPAANDNGCWAAVASNVLAGAGWGVGATAQQKADNIYQDFITNFKLLAADTYLTVGGSCAAGAKWWVHNIGLNPAYDGAGYTPTCTYVNFKEINRTLYQPDYDFLLGELQRCQYVGVKFYTGGDLMHGMTMVGGNWSPVAGGLAAQQWSVWHNSDNEGVGTDDEVYWNEWTGGGVPPIWYLDTNSPPTQGQTGDDWIAEGYFTVCPGVPKPQSAIENFDVHYYVGINGLAGGDPDFYLTGIDMLTTGTNYQTYTGPGGQGDWDPTWDSQDENTLIVPNLEDDSLSKKIYLSIDFNDPILPIGAELGEADLPDIQVFDDADLEADLIDFAWSQDPDGTLNGEQVLLTFLFDGYQPAWEKVVFPSDEYVNIDLCGNVGYNVYEWNLATECVPEPVTLALVGLGAIGLVIRRRRKRL